MDYLCRYIGSRAVLLKISETARHYMSGLSTHRRPNYHNIPLSRCIFPQIFEQIMVKVIFMFIIVNFTFGVFDMNVITFIPSLLCNRLLDHHGTQTHCSSPRQVFW